jgi:hypothetical protein
MLMTTFVSPVSSDRALADRITNIIRAASKSNPRSKQTSLGPSEIGEPCVRRIAYRLMNWDKVNDFSDPWPSISGTAIHAHLADIFTKDKSSSWLVEHRVTARKGCAGTVDLFDIDNGLVIDHKCVGATSMKARKAEGPTEQQIVQLNIYGMGLEEAGYEVKNIALAFYPLGGMLDGLHVWVGEYDRAVAEAALNRVDNVINLLVAVDPEVTPENWSMIPATTSRACTYCPWFAPGSTDLSIACPGSSAVTK